MTVTLDLAISAIRSGRKEEGRQLLNILIQQNPNNDRAWLWMSSVVQTDEQRARCLYHVLSIDPSNQLARKGLQLLGITVSDSRPVKIPRDSQPIHIPQPSTPPQQQPPALQQNGVAERRPFLIDPHMVTQPMPFTPMMPPQAQPHPEKIQASPAILGINLDEIPDSKPVQPASKETGVVSQSDDTESEVAAVNQPGTNKQLSDMFAAGANTRYTETQKMVAPNEADQVATDEPEERPVDEAVEAEAAKPKTEPRQPNPSTETSKPAKAAGEDQQQQGVNPANINPGYSPQTPNVPNETRPSQPVPVSYPHQNQPPGSAYPGYPASHSNATMGMPAPQQYGQSPGYPMLPLHSNVTMGMPMPGQEYRPPSEPMSPIHAGNTLGMLPNQYQQPFSGQGFHSNATMLMPTMSYDEARARLATGHMVPATDASAMALQNGSSQFSGYGNRAQFQYDEEEEESGEINIMAVIIFGTLSITALGGFGMLILLVFTAPPV